MKQLTCEMCGSTDLIKDGGMFICQSCGCKYSVEEAKKMMVEGTVEVAGTVKVDDTAKIENYLELSKKAYDSGNGESAYEYANKALEIAPKNSRAWIAKMKAIQYIATLGNLKLKEVFEAGKNAIEFADDASKKEITFEVYSYQAVRSLDLLKLAMNKMADTKRIEEYYNRCISIDVFTANGRTHQADGEALNLYDNIANEATALVRLIPDEVLADYPEITKIVGECAKQYQYETDELIKRMKIYGSSLTEAAKNKRQNIKTAIEEKAANAEKIILERKAKEQAERNSKYWEEHRDEKLTLEKEKVTLAEKVDKLEKELEALPENGAIIQLENQIATLKKEKDALGLFKGKEKKILQEQIDSLNVQLTAASTTRNNAMAPVKSEINELKENIKKIEAELNKDR